VYRITGSPNSERQTALAACLWAGNRAVVSHRTAGVLWKMDGITARQVEITVHAKQAPSSALVVVHRTLHLPRADQVTIGGIPITNPARTLIDLAGCVSEETLEAAVECACDAASSASQPFGGSLVEEAGAAQTSCDGSWTRATPARAPSSLGWR
jgi:hypothetical protein